MSTAKAASALCALQDTRRSPPSGNTPRSVSHTPLIEPDGLSVCRLECQAGCARSWSGLAESSPAWLSWPWARRAMAPSSLTSA